WSQLTRGDAPTFPELEMACDSRFTESQGRICGLRRAVAAQLGAEQVVLDRDPAPLENRTRVVTCGSSGHQATHAYSLIRPPRTGLRWIRPRSRARLSAPEPLQSPQIGRAS